MERKIGTRTWAKISPHLWKRPTNEVCKIRKVFQENLKRRDF